jgi:anaerobic selenocysteine-containing dehydrogenase
VDPLTGATRDAVFMNAEDARVLGFSNGDPVVLTNGSGRFEGHIFLAPIAPGNLQVHWPEGNILLRLGLVDSASGVPDYNAVVTVGR